MFSGGCYGRCLGFLWQFFVVLVVVVSCCDQSCGCNVLWVSTVLNDGFGWGSDRGGGFWLGLRTRCVGSGGGGLLWLRRESWV